MRDESGLARREPRLHGAIRAVGLAALAWLGCTTAMAAETRPLTVETPTLRVAFSARGARPETWEACHPSCSGVARRAVFNDSGDAPQLLVVIPDSASLTREIAALRYRHERRSEGSAVVVEFQSEPLREGVYVEKIYTVPDHGYELRFDVRVRGPDAADFAREHPLELRLIAGAAFQPAPAAGFGGLSERVSALSLRSSGTRALETGDRLPTEPGDWSGVRNRFWTLLAQTPQLRESSALGPGVVSLSFEPSTSLGVRFYSGPIQYGSLAAAEPALTQLLFSHLWFWIRWISLGMLALLNALHWLVGSYGVAILLLSLAIKVLMRPITALAESWHRDVNAKRSLLGPQIQLIKQRFRGEERSRELLALHREQGVNPFFGLKSAFGVLIQIPIFFAAYHMLDETFALSGTSFLWIGDLAAPDRIAALPFRIPFFGSELNALPFVMTSVTLASSWLYDDGSLSPELLRRQRLGLYAMAAAFFALFYTFPSGMVLYWTANNFIMLAKEGIQRLARRRTRLGGIGSNA